MSHGPLQFIGKVPDPESRFDSTGNLSHVKRFVNKVVRAYIEGFHLVVFKAGYNYDRNKFGLLLLFKPLADLQPVKAGHLYVEYDYLGIFL